MHKQTGLCDQGLGVSMYVYIQVKKIALQNIEDVGLTKDFKKYGNKKWSLNFRDKPKNQNPRYCFSVLHSIKTISVCRKLKMKYNNMGTFYTITIR